MKVKSPVFPSCNSASKKKIKVYYYLFDLLVWDEEDLRGLSLLERKKELKKHIPFGGNIRYTKHVREKGLEAYKKACKNGLEGVIAKKSDDRYHSKRTRNWLKFKCVHQQEFVIGGFTEPAGSRVGFGALLIGYYNKKGLHYAGKVGTGYDTALLKSLGARLKKLERKSCPFTTKPKQKNVHWVRPSIVCEISFTEWTKDGKLRHPAFLGIRKDKSAKNVRREG